MRKLRLIKRFSFKNSILIIIINIVFLTSLFLNTIGKKASSNMINISRTLINTINTNTVNNNIKMDVLKKYNMDNLITIKYADSKITDVNYNLENAYELLIVIKKSIIDSISDYMPNLYNYHYEINNNMVILEMPFYNYTNNLLLANLGPKIIVKMSMVRLIDGSVKTMIKNYGINSLLVELYLNFKVTSTIVVPNTKEEDVTNDYNVLLSSKVIQGEIPSIYNGLYENEKILNTN